MTPQVKTRLARANALMDNVFPEEISNTDKHAHWWAWEFMDWTRAAHVAASLALDDMPAHWPAHSKGRKRP